MFEVFREYEAWIYLGLAAIVAIILFLKLFTSIMEKQLPGKYSEKAIEIIREISQLSESQISGLKAMNQDRVVENFLKEANWTIENWEDHLKKKLDRASEHRLQNNIRVLPGSYQAIKKGGQFTENQSRKRIRKI